MNRHNALKGFIEKHIIKDKTFNRHDNWDSGILEEDDPEAKKKDQDLKTRHRIVNHLQIVIILYKKTESEHC